MKYLFLLIFIITSSCSVINRNYANVYTIQSIDSIDNFYLIYARKNDSIFKIVSRKQSYNSKGNEILIGRKYCLSLQPRIIKGSKYSSMNYWDTGCFNYGDSTTICLEENCVPNLYTTEDIKGLFVK